MSEKKKVFFCGSMDGGRQDAELYKRIILKLNTCGVHVLTEYVGYDKLKLEALHEEWGLKSNEDIYRKDLELITEADAILAEVTQPSLGVGYELGRAVLLDKRVLCLYRPQSDKRLSAMIRGAVNGEKFVVRDYREEEVDDIITQFTSSL